MCCPGVIQLQACSTDLRPLCGELRGWEGPPPQIGVVSASDADNLQFQKPYCYARFKFYIASTVHCSLNGTISCSQFCIRPEASPLPPSSAENSCHVERSRDTGADHTCMAAGALYFTALENKIWIIRSILLSSPHH